MLLKKILPLFIVFLIPFFGIAQETTSQILGTVSDGKNGLEGATIIAIHVPTGTKYSTTSRRDGHYNLSGLRVGGPYTLTATFAGFIEQKQENITLNLGQDYAGDFTLVAATSELKDVVVSSANQNKVFNTSRTGAQEIVTRNQIERLPTISRSIQDFTKLEPSSNGLSFGGAYSGFNNITVNGADFNNSFGLSGTLGGQASAQPISLDAIDQIQVNLSPYDVRQGGFTGAGINAVTRSGTNQFRGSVYTYIKGPGTQGYKVGTSKVARTPFSFNLSGASIGGAIVKDKLFFFINGEQSIQSAPATSIVASTASNPAVAGSVSQANADTLAKLADFLKTTYNYDPGAYQGYSFKTNSYKVNARIDWNINDKNTFSFMYNYLKSYADQFASTSRPGSGQVTGGQPGTYSMPFYGSGYRINNNLNIYIAELNSRFSNATSNKLQVGYTRERDFRSPQSSSSTFPLVDILNSGNIYTTFGFEQYTYNNTLNMDSYQLTDIFSLYKGAHEITIGTQNSYKKYTNAFAPGYNGVYQFSSLSDFMSGAPAATYYQAYSTLEGAAFPWAYAGATNLSLFAQDKWRASDKFTLIYGIRGDYTTYQNKFTDNPNFDDLAFKNGVKYNVGKAPNGFVVISPRVGFNWDIKGDKSWQLRGGAGIFEGAPPFVWIENQAANNGVQFGSFTATKFPFYANSQDALNYYLTSHNITQTSTPTSYSVNVIDKKFKYPTKLKTNIALDKRFAGDWIVTGEFSYTKDINASYMYNANLNEENGFAITNGGDSRMRYNTTATSTGGTNSSNKYYNGTSLTEPNLGNVMILANTHKGWSYTATARVQKNFKNLSTSLAYTYQDVRTAMEGGSTASSLWSARPVANTDPNAPTLARPSWYQPHRVVAFASYRFDYAKHLATSIGIYYEASTAGSTSYVYNGDLNGDGNTGNDLIYIPKSSSDINLVDVNAGSANINNSKLDHSDSRSTSQIWNQINNFINQDHYLSSRRGQYAQANSVLLPWFKQMNLNVTQDIYFYTHGSNGIKDKHTLRVSVDITNFGNLLNKNWGLLKLPSSTNFLKFEGMAADGKTPTFSFPYADATNQTPYVNSFNNNTSIASRWQMQIGIRYLFN